MSGRTSVKYITKIVDGVKLKCCSKCLEFKPFTDFDFMKRGTTKCQPACKVCRRAWYKADPKYFQKLEQNREYSKVAKKLLRAEVLVHYGNKCACCGETRQEFLAIDHIDGNGNQHRKSIKKTIYRWLKQNNFPENFRLLCHNCNASRGYYGYCPHEKEKEEQCREDV